VPPETNLIADCYLEFKSQQTDHINIVCVFELSAMIAV
jgi:hypothetical protein